MTDLVLIGGGALARELMEWFAPQLALTGDRFSGYLDDTGAAMETFGAPLPWLGPIADHTPSGDVKFVMAIGEPAPRMSLAAGIRERGGRFASLLHDRAWISVSAKLGEGVTVGPFAHVSTGAVAGDLVQINTFSGIGHDASVGEGGCLSTHVDLTGGVKVGARCFFGSGARVLPRLTIGDDCRIGAGAVVVRSAPAGATLFAAPARRLA